MNLVWAFGTRDGSEVPGSVQEEVVLLTCCLAWNKEEIVPITP